MGKKKGGSLWIFCLIWSYCESKTPVQIVQRPAVTRSECSTWGSFHFQTFDHVKFDFPGICHYVFASHCNDSYQDFNIQVRRSDKNGFPVCFTATIDGVLLEVKESGITVNGHEIPLPFSLKSILIEDTCTYFQVTSTLGLTLKWNWADTLLLDLEDTYKGKTCGLCGNYDGNEKNDLHLNGYKLLPRQFGNLHKVEEPTEKCPDVAEDEDAKNHKGHVHHQKNKCSKYISKCKKLLAHLGNCSRVVAFDDYVATCTGDMCICAKNSSSDSALVSSCICSTLSQYSRDCVLNGGIPGKWRTKDLCFQECPNNLEYMECGNPCADTCANPERSKICKAPCTDGCFCPAGTILDDMNGNKCIPIDTCPCMFQGKVYASGGSYSTPSQNCTCAGGQWVCVSLPLSGNCNVKGGFHITTFDNKEFIFHGNCHYVLAKNIRLCSCGNVYINNFIAMLPITREKFGQHWCELLSNTSGVFAACHSVVDPSLYVKNCVYDTCNAEKSEAALCSVLSTYSRDCAARGVHLKGWRHGVCDVSKDCPETMVFSYDVKFCNHSCRSLGEPDLLCNVQSTPVEGCGCPKETYLNADECVSPDDCPCYYKDKTIQAGKSFQEDKLMCTCNNRQWNCTENPCQGTCTVYGNGHYLSFDGEKFDFMGDCDYILAQINPMPYYESCVSDFCGCDSVGDCECFCTSVAAYSRSCNRVGVCIDWRRPSICRPKPKERADEESEITSPKSRRSGTCTNQKSDDAMKRNGEIADSFKEMALDWRVPDPTNRHCELNTLAPAQTETSLSKVGVCAPSALCKLIWKTTIPLQDKDPALVEGCYCPEGKILLNNLDGLCVSVCVPKSVCVSEGVEYKGTVVTTSDGCCKTCIPLSHVCKLKLKKEYITHKNCKSAAPVLVPSCEGSCSTYSVPGSSKRPEIMLLKQAEETLYVV
ncbi:unnamed protein product [Caretta caretta]